MAKLYEEFQVILGDVQTFLHSHITQIQPAFKSLAGLIPPLNQLVDLLDGLIAKLHDTLVALTANTPLTPDQQAIAAEYAKQAQAFLRGAKTLFPERAAEIDAVLALPVVADELLELIGIKSQVADLLTAINADLATLKA